MLYRNLFLFLFFFAKFHSYEGCRASENKIIIPSREYDLERPSKLILREDLNEISGISFYPKDSSVFAISDETGYLYKIHLNKRFITEQWKFGKKKDFEDVMHYGDSFYILESNGNIQTLTFTPKGDTIYRRRTVFPGDNTKKNEFESLYYDEMYKGFVMICKDCEDDTHNFTTAWLFDPFQNKFIPSIFKIDRNPIANKLGLEKLKFRPSGAAINPITKDVWIISSINQLIVVLDRKGVMKDVYTLNPVIFNQPEGITFTPWGDLLISNEAGDKYGTASLLIFKPKK